MAEKFSVHRCVTTWSPPHEMLKTQYGYVSYKQWCIREIERFKPFKHLAIIEKNGEICLYNPN